MHLVKGDDERRCTQYKGVLYEPGLQEYEPGVKVDVPGVKEDVYGVKRMFMV